jgi:hypothetical protein
LARLDPATDPGDRPNASYGSPIRLVPAIRITKAEGRRHGERDAFLAPADIAGKDAGLKRDDAIGAFG